MANEEERFAAAGWTWVPSVGLWRRSSDGAFARYAEARAEVLTSEIERLTKERDEALAERDRLQADSTRERGIGHRCMARLSNALAAEPVAYERGLRRGLAIARENEGEDPAGYAYDFSVDWAAATEQMEREIEEAKR